MGLPPDDATDDATDDPLVLARKMELVGRLAPGLIHDLNNSLAAIGGFSQLLKVDPRLPEELRTDAGLLVAEADRTRRLIQGVLDFVRERPPERYPTAVGALFDSVLELAGYPLRRAQVEVVLDLPADLPLVAVDRPRIQQVLVDVLLDAARSVGSRDTGSRLSIEASSPDAATVRLALALDPSDPTHRSDFSVSAAIVASHGGRLAVEPQPEPGRSAVVIVLPVRATPP